MPITIAIFKRCLKMYETEKKSDFYKEIESLVQRMEKEYQEYMTTLEKQNRTDTVLYSVYKRLVG